MLSPCHLLFVLHLSALRHVTSSHADVDSAMSVPFDDRPSEQTGFTRFDRAGTICAHITDHCDLREALWYSDKCG